MAYKTNDDFRSALKRFRLSQREFARIIDTDFTAVNRWAIGKSKVPGAAWTLIKLLDQRPELVQLVRGF